MISGKLSIVATPIGNLGDITLRAIEVLKEADRICAEDTRHTRQLLDKLGFKKPLVALHDHNEKQQAELVCSWMEEGQKIALVSDAGTPLIADPGYHLVKYARGHGYKVEPIPGPSAIITALSAAGLPTDQFSFAGFIPAKNKARTDFLGRCLTTFPGTVVCYETPHRILDTLDALNELAPERELMLTRELTKLFEDFIPGTATTIKSVLEEHKEKQKGEMVLLIAANQQEKQITLSQDAQKAATLLAKEMAPSKAAKLVASLYDVNKKQVYEFLQQ